MKQIQQRRFYIGLCLFFFISGIYWGKFFYYGEENDLSLFRKSKLVVLAEFGALPDSWVKNFMLHNDVDIKVKTYNDATELKQILSQEPVDVVVYKSHNAEALLHGNFVQKIAKEQVDQDMSIAADFKKPPYDKDNEFTLPLFWGVLGASLWTENVSIASTSKHLEAAYEFINHLLKGEVATELARTRQVASTNPLVEPAAELRSNLKPSYLRKISIKDLKHVE